jgi:predicted CXXCH cytochrome family protein
MDTHSEVHKAVTMNDSSCIYCHDAHGSNYNYFTKDKLPDLCLDCHSDIIDDNAKSVHGIITGTEDNKKSCANCHNPHSADIKPLLKKEKKELCLSCHDREYQTKYADGSARTIPNIKLKIKGPGVHPIAKNEANCTMCHSPHASLYSAILTKKYPVTPYEKYTPKKDKIPNSYELCFTCHEEGMLKPDIAEEDTDFRNDVKGADGKIVRENLHWFHVVNAAGSPEPEKGRSCFVCHDPHGSDQKHMIKTAFRLNGTTNVNVSYTATKIGGECANTCHSDPIKRYNRAQ